MAITTEFVLRSTSLPLVSIPIALRPDEIECVHALCLQPDVQIFTVRFEREDGITKADLLTRDEVVTVSIIGGTTDKGIYKFTVKLARSVSKTFEPDFGGTQVEPAVVTADGRHETKAFEEYEGFNGFRKSREARGISLDLVSIASEGSASGEPTNSLAGRQWEALMLAVSRGYYESSRQTTAEKLAAKLGISQPSLSSLLRRGERELVTSSLGMRARMQSPAQ